jgi:tetratricopeptide (TPR) repeat protein
MSDQFGKRLRRLRVAAGLTQNELASPSYTHAYVSTLEAGRRHPSSAALQHFASKLNVTVDELQTGRPPDLATQLSLRTHEARLALSHGRHDESESLLQEVMRRARRYRLPGVEAQARATLALRNEQVGKLEEAIDGYEAAEQLLNENPSPDRAYAVAGQARCHHMLGDVRYAIHLLETLLEEMERDHLREPDALVRLYSPLVLAYFDAGLFEKASTVASEALKLSSRVTDPGNLAAMHVNVARLLLNQGRSRQAERSLRRAEDLYGQLDFPAEAGVAHLARGYVLLRRGELDKAEKELLAAKRMLHSSNSRINEAHALNELGRLARLQGRSGEAQKLLRQAKRQLSGGSDISGLAWAERELGICLSETDSAGAEKRYRAAIALYERSGDRLQLAATYRFLGDLLNEQGRTKDALSAFRAGILGLEVDL